MSTPATPAPPAVLVPKLKAIEPPTFHGIINTVDNWIFSLELYFVAINLDYLGNGSTQACAVASALLRDQALQWFKRLYR